MKNLFIDSSSKVLIALITFLRKQNNHHCKEGRATFYDLEKNVAPPKIIIGKCIDQIFIIVNTFK